MQIIGKLVVAVLSIGTAGACSCAPVPLPPPGTPVVAPAPLLKGREAPFFAGVVEEVYPRSLSEYEAQWLKIYGERPSEDKPPSVEQYRSFFLQFRPKLYSTAERERMTQAKTIDEIDSALRRFWVMPRRVQLNIVEPFAGPQSGRFELYTGMGGGDCGVSFKVGERWLIDARLDEGGRWVAHACSLTTLVKDAGALLKRLRAERP